MERLRCQGAKQADLDRLRQDGLVIGLTTSGPQQADVIERALGVDAGGVNPFASVQSTWNVLEVSPKLIERVLVKLVVASRVPALTVSNPDVAPRFASLLTVRIPPLIVVPPE